METIYKFQLAIQGEQTIKIPNGFTPLHVAVQEPGSVPCMWCRVDPSRSVIEQKIITHGTGHPFSETTGEYIGSYMLQGGALVLHVFLAS